MLSFRSFPNRCRGFGCCHRYWRPSLLGWRAERPLNMSFKQEATRNKCIASSNKCLTSSNKKLLGTRDTSKTVPSSFFLLLLVRHLLLEAMHLLLVASCFGINLLWSPWRTCETRFRSAYSLRRAMCSHTFSPPSICFSLPKWKSHMEFWS